MARKSNFQCLYCKSPRFDISYTSTKNESFSVTTPPLPVLPSAGISGGESIQINKTPKIKCHYCNREYLLFGTKKEKSFFKHVRSKLKFHGSLIAEMHDKDLEVEDITNGYIGITRLLLQYFKIIHRDQYHILFEADGNVYYLVCRRIDGKMVAVQLMEAS